MEEPKLNPEVKELLERFSDLLYELIGGSSEAERILVQLAARETYIPAIGLHIMTRPWEEPKGEEKEKQRLFFVDPEGNATEQNDANWIRRMGIKIEEVD